MLLSNGAPGTRKKSVSFSQRFSMYVMALPNEELGSTNLSSNCVFSHPCSSFITGVLCS
jgi:hypothetical protein